MKSTARHLVLLLIVGLALAACQSSAPEGTKTSAGFLAPSKDFVWNTAINALKRQGFAPDTEASDREAGIVTTRWLLSLQPFSGMGYRDMATVTINEVPGKPNFFTVDTRVVREFNANMVHPSNPVVADWEKPERVGELEQIINQRIEMFFRTGDASPDFRERYGMPR